MNCLIFLQCNFSFSVACTNLTILTTVASEKLHRVDYYSFLLAVVLMSVPCFSFEFWPENWRDMLFLNYVLSKIVTSISIMWKPHSVTNVILVYRLCVDLVISWFSPLNNYLILLSNFPLVPALFLAFWWNWKLSTELEQKTRCNLGSVVICYYELKVFCEDIMNQGS